VLSQKKSIFCFKQLNILCEEDDSLSNRSVIILNGLKRSSKYSTNKRAQLTHQDVLMLSVVFFFML